MSVEDAPPPTEANASATMPTPTASESEIVALLREQNALLRELVASTRPSRNSRFTDADWNKAKAIAAQVAPSEEARHVVVDVTTGAYATGRTIFAAAQSLGAPADCTVAVPAGGVTLRLRAPGRRA